MRGETGFTRRVCVAGVLTAEFEGLAKALMSAPLASVIFRGLSRA